MPIFINKRIFWDTRLEDIDLQVHKNFVIARVFEWANLEKLKVLLKFYIKEEIVEALTKEKYLSKKLSSLHRPYWTYLKKILNVIHRDSYTPVHGLSEKIDRDT